MLSVLNKQDQVVRLVDAIQLQVSHGTLTEFGQFSRPSEAKRLLWLMTALVYSVPEFYDVNVDITTTSSRHTNFQTSNDHSCHFMTHSGAKRLFDRYQYARSVHAISRSDLLVSY